MNSSSVSLSMSGGGGRKGRSQDGLFQAAGRLTLANVPCGGICYENTESRCPEGTTAPILSSSPDPWTSPRASSQQREG